MRVIIYRIIPKDALSSYLHELTRICTKHKGRRHKGIGNSYSHKGQSGEGEFQI